MDRDIRIALTSLQHAIACARGPIFTDADRGRVLLAFMAVCEAMDDQDRHFKAKAAEADRIEKAAEKERCSRENEVELKRLFDQLGDPFDD